MIEYINKARPCHIITIEDPIEFLYHDKKAFITQREIGIDTETFEEALRFLPRQDPDIVLIGEMRDRQTFQAALRVAETGHLVFGTVHAPSAAQTIGRIVELWPAESRTPHPKIPRLQPQGDHMPAAAADDLNRVRPHSGTGGDAGASFCPTVD